MLGLAQIDPAEVAFGEHHALGPQPAQIVVAKIVRSEFALGPDSFGFGHHAISRAPTGARSARTP